VPLFGNQAAEHQLVACDVEQR